jgi:glycosyltransferase involved in cell wall biosynthesis
LNIAVNTRLLLHGRLEGIGWFTFENLKRVTLSHPEHQFYFIFDRPYHAEFIFSTNVHPIVIAPQARHPLLYYVWFEFSIRRVLKKIKADLFLSPDGYMSLGSKVPGIAVFHDLNFEHYPEDLPSAERWYYRHFFPKYAHKAMRIATVSEFSKQDIVTQYGVDPKKIDVVYNGANEQYAPLDEAQKAAALQKFTSGKPYFFFVGALHPRKNLINLFRAFELFKMQDKNGTMLLIAGARKWWTGEIAEVYERLNCKEYIKFAGRLSTADMKLAMGAAMALTYVSYFEGFGIPIIEAFRCGTPVITSNVTSMPEIAGDAALLVDPFDPENIEKAMQTVSNFPEKTDALIKSGFQRTEIFTWDKSAERLWNTLQKVIDDL